LWGIVDHRLLSGGYEPRQLGSLGVKSCGRSTAKPPVLGTDQAISEIGGRILPDEQSFLDGRFILELNIGRIEQARDSLNYQRLWQAVSAAQYPFGFHDNQMTYENAAPGRELTLDQFACLLELGFVIPNQKANEYVGIDPQHHRDNCSTGTGLRPFLCNVPASSATLLDFNRMTTVASGIKVNVIRSPAFMERLSRISLGIVVWPLLVSVASFDMGGSKFLTFPIIVRMSIAGNMATTGYLNDFDPMAVPAGRSSPNRTPQFHHMQRAGGGSRRRRDGGKRPKADRQTFSRFDGYAAIEAIQDGEAWDLSSGLPIPAAPLQSVESEPVGRPAPNILMA
jgi:hypothetical protein